MTELVTTKVVQTGFLKTKRPVDAMRRALARSFPDAVELLTETMNDVSEKKSVRLDAAKLLMTTYVTVVKDASNDEIKRLESQIKYVDRAAAAELETDDDTPQLDYGNIADPEDIPQ